MDSLRVRGPDRNNHRVPHALLARERPLDVLGMHVHAVRGDNEVFFPAPVHQPAFGIPRADVSRMEPAVRIDGARPAGASLEVLADHAGPSHENFSVLRDPDLLAADHLAQRAAARPERMVDRNHRARFGEAVALDYEESDPGPEFLGFRVQHRASNDEGPELQSEGPMDVSVAPPPAERSARPLLHLLGPRMAPLDVVPQAVEQAGNGDQNRNPLSANRLADRGRMQPGHEGRRAFEQERDEEAHRLPEHMAKGQKVEDPDRLERAGPFLVAIDLLPDRIKVRADVPVEMDHPLGLGSGSGGVDDLHDIVAAGGGRVEAGSVRQPIERLDRKAIQGRCRASRPATVNQQLRARLQDDSVHEFRRGLAIQRNHLNLASQAGPEDGGPFRPVVGPQHHAISRSDPVAIQIGDEAADSRVQIGVGPTPCAVSVPEPHRLPRAEAFDPRQKFQQRLHAATLMHSLVHTFRRGAPRADSVANSS